MIKKGFTLIELLVVIAVIGIVSGVAILALGGAQASARDARRKAELSQVKRMFVSSCYVPASGAGIYDISTLIGEIKAKYPQYSSQTISMPRDPKAGNGADSNYKYMVADDGKNCVLFANLENEAEPVTLPGLSAPEPGKGTGVFQSSTKGWNGSTKYFQVSN